MANKVSAAVPRRVVAYEHILGQTQLHLRNPYIIAFWSAMFPGLGHLLLSRYFRAFILFLWEIALNLLSHVNAALFYTLLGQFDEAGAVVDIRWSLLYVPTYIFTIWDSYRSAVDLNKQYILADRENAKIDVFTIGLMGVNFLDKRGPIVPSIWSGLTPGLGHLALQHILHGFFMLLLWTLVVSFSNVLTAVHLTFYGEFLKARDCLSTQWFLNIPSLLFFCVYATYVNATESNKLFDREMKLFLGDHYQSPEFPFPGKHSGDAGAGMYVISSFEQTLRIELAVTALEQAGVDKKDILAVPIEKTVRSGKLSDTINSSTGDSLLDLPAILATVMALLGSVYGYVLRWGPIVWGALGALAGLALGLIIKLIWIKKRSSGGVRTEDVILVFCEEAKADSIGKILRDNGALGVSIVKGA